MKNELDRFEGMKEMTVSVGRLNKIALGVIVPVFVFLFCYFYYHWTAIYSMIIDSSAWKTIGAVVLFFLLYFVAVVLHELIHGVFFARYATNGWQSVKFGVLWQFLTPYCHCKEAVEAKHYRITLLMPTILLGFLPLVVGLLTGSLMLIILACFLILGGSGDFALWWVVRKLPKHTRIYDHPSKIGFYIEEPV